MIIGKLIRPQTCDMGSNYVEYEMTEDMTLDQVLEWIKENNICAFGTITISFRDGDILRKFDYDLFHKNERSFYYNFGWEGKKIVNKMTSQACFMYCDFEIQLR